MFDKWRYMNQNSISYLVPQSGFLQISLDDLDDLNYDALAWWHASLQDNLKLYGLISFKSSTFWYDRVRSPLSYCITSYNINLSFSNFSLFYHFRLQCFQCHLWVHWKINYSKFFYDNAARCNFTYNRLDNRCFL